MASIDKSSKALIEDVIDRLKLSSCFKITETNIINTINGSTIDFMGLLGRSKVDTRTKMKSLEGYDIVWCEEAEGMAYDSISRIHKTVRGEGKQIIYTLNPFLDPDPIFKFYREKENKLFIEMNYVDNPFCPADIIQDADESKRIDPVMFEHEFMGKPLRNPDTQVFKNKFEVRTFDLEEIRKKQPDIRLYYGVDWGFSKDPTVGLRAYIYDNCLWVDYEAGGVGIEIDKIYIMLNELPEMKKWVVYADNARPETISYLQKSCYNIQPCKKWKGSIEDGVAHLRAYKMIYIHPRCRKTIEEFTMYSYKQDEVTKEIFPQIVDKYNHRIDALRYALTPLITNRSGRPIEFYV
jgi:phage terminase large subunit